MAGNRAGAGPDALRINAATAGVSWLLVSGGSVLVVAAVAATAARGLADPPVAVAFGLFIAFGEFVRVTLPGDREAAPLAAAGALGYVLLSDVHGAESSHDALAVVAVTACGMLLGALPHAAAGRSPRLDYLARRLLTVGLAAGLFRPFYANGPLDTLSDDSPVLFAGFMVVVITSAGVVDAGLAATVRAGRDGAPYAATMRDELRALLGIGSAIGATGMLIALATEAMYLWALPVFAIPLLLAQFSFRRYAAIQSTYLQTIRALSRVTELGGYTETGHARRVSQLSVAVGRELGMSERQLRTLEYAALMHDIGQLSLADPIPGGATVMASPPEQRRIAALGARVIRQTGVLDEVATVVERQAEPYRRPHAGDDRDVPLASRIIRAVNAYDDLAGGSAETARHLHALERLRLGTAHDYDPRVLDSLSRVTARAARLGT
ncbi:MAG: HD-GYP domain-containing protein [Carbonactinosporaceae bacterium]